jgi:uncharacterized membrane protein (UPF0127 family)
MLSAMREITMIVHAVRQRAMPRLAGHTAALSARVALALVLLVASTARAQAPGTNSAQPKLPTVELSAGIHLIKAEVADRFETRMRGLMYRERLGANEGMLFVFQDKSPQCFWMKNTVLPLSIAFIDDDGAIVNIADMKPLDETSHCSARPVRFALEMEQGWFHRRGIRAGSALGLGRMSPRALKGT